MRKQIRNAEDRMRNDRLRLAVRNSAIRQPQFAMTLVELLVVIAIVSILVTTAIPVLAPGGDSRRLREASRGVNSFFAGARSRAVQTGRPYGVAIRRLSADTGNVDDNGVGVQLSYVEVPPVYSGLDGNSVVRIGQVNNPGTGLRQFRLQFLRRGVADNGDNLPPGIDRDLVPGSFLRIGDVVQVGGSRFRLTDGDGTTTLQVSRSTASGEAGFFKRQVTALETYALLPFTDEAPVEIALRYKWTGDRIPPPETEEVSIAAALPLAIRERTYWSAPLPYQIFRQPIPSAAQPLQLPEGTAIDLQASGFTSGVQLHRPEDALLTTSFLPDGGEVFHDDVMILFSPEGSISRAYFRAYRGNDDKTKNPPPNDTNVSSTLALLIGRRELIPAEVLTTPTALLASVSRDDPAVIDLATYKNTYEDEATREALEKYNWMNPDSRWVVVGAQSGAVSTVENAIIDPLLDVDGDGNADMDWFDPTANPPDYFGSDGKISFVEQMSGALENAIRRNTSAR